jgi:hypothetical protein
VLEAFEGGEPSRIVFLVPDQKSGLGPAKSGQQNGAHAKALHLEASTHAAFFSESNLDVKFEQSNPAEKKLRHRTGRRACSCSTSPLSRAKNPNKKGTKKRREGFARSPADDAADGVALFDHARDSFREKSRKENHEAKESALFRKKFSDSKNGRMDSGNSRAWIITTNVWN